MKKFAWIIAVMVIAGAGFGQPNILFITVDDMNADSVGVYGCPVQDSTPNLDKLAGQGMRFEQAYVQVANCTPSRNALQSGRYPHNSGVEGFYDVAPDYPILPDLLKAKGYRTGIWGKVADTTPRSAYAWDEILKTYGKGNAKDMVEIGRATLAFINGSQSEKRPFYLVMNLSDPHHPLYGSPASVKNNYDLHPPSRIYTSDEVTVPGFLPDIPGVRDEITRYYNSVRRADDIIGAILEALETSGQAEKTVVMFLSDHGMPFPFAKTNLYRHSTRTPWMLRWPGVVEPGRVDRDHMISAIDFMPTLLEICGIDAPEGIDGRSFVPILKGGMQEDRDRVITEYHENAGGIRNPMRSIQTKRYGYIFNPWSDGKRLFKSATLYSASYKAMQKAAVSDEDIAARVAFFNHRCPEEFYDYEKDPDALHNLIDDPAYAALIHQLRSEMEKWMEETGDEALEVFRNRDSAIARADFMAVQEAKSKVLNNNGLGRKRE